MREKEKISHLTLDWESADSALAVTGSVAPGEEEALQSVMEEARDAERDVVIILTHQSQEAEAEAEAPAPATEGLEAERVVIGLGMIAGAVARALEQKESMSALIDQLSPPTKVLSSPALLQARRNAAARSALFEEFGFLTGAEVSDLAGSSATNRSALPTRWRKERRIFAVPQHGALYYPLFQFSADGQPLPVIGEVLGSFQGIGMSDWEVALWFAGRNGWLRDLRPVDLLGEEPEAVVEAALREADEIAG